MKTLIKSIIYCHAVPLDHLLMYAAKIVKQGFSAYALNLSKSGNILFRKMSSGKCLFSSTSLTLMVGEITRCCMNFEAAL